MTELIDVVVSAREEAANGVVALELSAAAQGTLPAWEPGAHIDLHLGDGMVRQYSLCGDPDDRSRWRIAVLRESEGRGGSCFVHDHLHRGTPVRASQPRNNFPLAPATRYAFIAGGIGITPLLPMIAAAEASGRPWRLTYGGRNAASMAFADDLVARYPDAVTLVPQDEAGLIDLPAAIGDADAVYVCGPEPLLSAVEATCPPGALHLERFAARTVDPDLVDLAFEVELARSGNVVTVEAGTSLLQELHDVGVDLEFCCEEGVCGSCEIAVLSGVVDHRDSILTDEERSRNDTMFPCVSRAAGGRLVLDL